MADFIKLTTIDGREVYVNPNHIICFGLKPRSEITAVNFQGIDDYVEVKESPGYILNMIRQFTNQSRH